MTLPQCPEHSPLTGKRCVRIGPHEEHQDRHARDVYCHVWEVV